MLGLSKEFNPWFIIESGMQTACIQKLAHVGVPWYFLGNPISINSRKDCLTCIIAR